MLVLIIRMKITPSPRLFSYPDGSLWSSGKLFRSAGNVTADTINHCVEESQGKPNAEIQSCDLRDLGNEDSMISGFHKTRREDVRPEAYSILSGGVAARGLIFSGLKAFCGKFGND